MEIDEHKLLSLTLKDLADVNIELKSICSAGDGFFSIQMSTSPQPTNYDLFNSFAQINWQADYELFVNLNKEHICYYKMMQLAMADFRSAVSRFFSGVTHIIHDDFIHFARKLVQESVELPENAMDMTLLEFCRWADTTLDWDLCNDYKFQEEPGIERWNWT